jgi:ribosomal protein S14
VEYVLATVHATLERLQVAQIAYDAVHRQVVDIVSAATGSDKYAQVRTVVQQLPRHVTSEKARCSCDKTLHPMFAIRVFKIYREKLRKGATQ